MKVCTNVAPSTSCCGLKTTATLGTFDGVHVGHRHILSQVIVNARRSGKESAVVTFDRHPSAVLRPESSPGMLNTLEEKLSVFEDIGIDVVYVLTFSKEIADMTAEQFIEEYLLRCLGMSHFIVGYDHGFGKNRNGAADNLAELAERHGFTLDVLHPLSVDGFIVNSSAIRNLIAEGKVAFASELLEKDYSFDGTVVTGHGLGKKIGFPTANIDFHNPEKIIPLKGIYSGWITVNNATFDAVISIGPRPTFDNYEDAVEVHIPGFDGDIYGKSVKVGFHHRLRDIIKFDSVNTLVEQIKKDIELMNQHIPF